MRDLLALVPVYNEAASVRRVLIDLSRHVRDIIVVNDGSTDASRYEIMKAACSPELDGCRVYYHDRLVNGGMIAAVRSGLALAQGLLETGRITRNAAILMVDSDGQHELEDIASLVDALQEGPSDLVIGRRNLGAYPLSKRVANVGMSLLCGLICGRYVPDVESGFRVIRATLIPRLLPWLDGTRYSVAQVMTVAAALSSPRMNGRPPVRIRHYRSRTRLRDVVNNLFWACVCSMRIRRHLPPRGPEPENGWLLLTGPSGSADA